MTHCGKSELYRTLESNVDCCSIVAANGLQPEEVVTRPLSCQYLGHRGHHIDSRDCTLSHLSTCLICITPSRNVFTHFPRSRNPCSPNRVYPISKHSQWGNSPQRFEKIMEIVKSFSADGKSEQEERPRQV